MQGGVVIPDKIPEHFIKTVNRRDGIRFQVIDPGFLHGAPEPLTFPFAGSVPDSGMDQFYADTDTDHGKLFVGIRRSVIDSIPNSE